MSLYTELAATARQILEEFGMAATLYKRTAGAYNASTGRVTQVETSYPITVALMDQPEATLANSAVVQKQRKCFIAADGLTVSIDNEDVIGIGSKKYKVVDPGAIAPAGVVVVYDATLAI